MAAAKGWYPECWDVVVVEGELHTTGPLRFSVTVQQADDYYSPTEVNKCSKGCLPGGAQNYMIVSLAEDGGVVVRSLTSPDCKKELESLGPKKAQICWNPADKDPPDRKLGFVRRMIRTLKLQPKDSDRKRDSSLIY